MANWNKILVLSLAGIGDTLMATPVLHELRAQFPDAELDVLVMWSGAAQILGGNPHITRIYQHDFIKTGRIASLLFLRRLRKERYDLSLTLHPQGRREYRSITRLIGARRRLSHEYENHSWKDGWLVTDELPQDYTLHCVANNLRLLSLLQRPLLLPSQEYELFLSVAERDWARATAQEFRLQPGRWLGVHVGSGGTKNLALRRWPLDQYETLFVDLFQRDPAQQIVLLGGPEEIAAHAQLRARFTKEIGEGRLLIPITPTLRHAAALLGEAGQFLSVDTVFMHLATAARVPRQFVIETPTLNPPVYPFRSEWIKIPNPAIGNRHLDFYRYDGRPIAGTAAELECLMRSVTPAQVAAALAIKP